MTERRKYWGSLAVMAVLGSGSGAGTSAFYLNNISATELQEIARPDPATGTELRAMQRDIEYHMRNHPDVINQFDRRLTRLETRLETFMERQQ